MTVDNHSNDGYDYYHNYYIKKLAMSVICCVIKKKNVF